MNFRDLPLERSDDRRRGSMPHLAKAIDQLRGMGTRCSRCRETATHLIDTRNVPRAVCARCAGDWQRMSPEQRIEARGDFARRGLL